MPVHVGQRLNITLLHSLRSCQENRLYSARRLERLKSVSCRTKDFANERRREIILTRITNE